MRYSAIAALLAGVALATPVPQDFDWDAIDNMDPLPVPDDIPVVSASAAQTTLSYEPSAAASSVSSAIYADPTDTNLKARQATCNTAGTADTDVNWAANPQWVNDAMSATTPSGYNLIYQNQTASSNNVYGYMGFSTMSSYNVQTCANRCTKITGCNSFNIYYERDPSSDPTSSCPNPPSITVVKCVYYGAPVTVASVTNFGQYRKNFHVVIAGSNGYATPGVATPVGFTNSVYMGAASLNAPLDCNNADTYMGVKTFTDGIFSVQKCADACSAQTKYNLQYPPSTGLPMTCQFFNTYILYQNNVPQGQICTLYNETWPLSFATNKGQTRGSDVYTVGYSFAFSNATGMGVIDTPAGCKNPTKPQ